MVLAGIAFASIYSAYFMVRDMLGLRAEAQYLQTQKEELLQKKEELEDYLAEMQTRVAIEREAKEQFNMKNMGEEVVIVVPEKKKIRAASTTAETGVWTRLKYIFFR